MDVVINKYMYESIIIHKNVPYVYILIDPRNALPFYIGKGTNNRVFSHFYDNYTKSYNPIKTNKINSIVKSGQKVNIAILYHDTEQRAYKEERKLIESYGRVVNKSGILTNLNEGGKGGNTGYKMSPSVLAKLKLRRKGIKTEAGLERIRLAVSGPKSEAHKKKLQNNCPRSRPVLQFTKTGEFVAEFVSGREASKQTGVGNDTISRCCGGYIKSSGGYVWKFK